MPPRESATTDEIWEPTIVLLGCQPWPPINWSGDPDRCPVCGYGVQSKEHGTYCGWSDEGSPAFEARVRAAQLGLRTPTESQVQEQQRESKLKAAKIDTLSESDRRRIWNGYKGNLLTELVGPALHNAAKEGREFLARINQLPDWTVTLKGMEIREGRRRAQVRQRRQR